MSLHLRILTPSGTVVDCPVKEVTATGLEGEFGVLAGHLPFLTALKIGPSVFTEAESFEPRYFALGKGYAEVYGSQITLFVDSAEESTQIDVERAQRALARSQKELSTLGQLPVSDPDYIRTSQAQMRAQTRINIASRR